MRDPGFSKRYNWENLAGLPGTGHVYQFHGRDQPTYSEGFVLRVIPDNGAPWIGNFQPGNGTFTGVFSYPLELIICVVVKGIGYLVAVNKPMEYEIVKSDPIREVRSLLEKRIIVFADFTDLTAYGPQGILWRTSGLSWDGLKITEVTPDFIRGIAWDAPQQREVEFLVDVQTGHYEGGVKPYRALA
jgi:hypothetical protein